MKAQTSRTTEISTSLEQTPVIVKIGGGDVVEKNSANGDEFSIYSPEMPFMDSTGDTWSKAWSTQSGRIHELSLEKGDQKAMYCQVLPQPNMVTSLEVTFQEDEKLRLYEKPEEGSFVLYVESHGFSFQATDPKSEGWKKSHAPLPGTPVKLLFTQKQIGATENNVKFEYVFDVLDPNVTFSLDFRTIVK
jgi:hypothetical protein